jgi:hypothetical protein
MNSLVKPRSALGDSIQPRGRKLHEETAPATVVKRVPVRVAWRRKHETQGATFPAPGPDLLGEASLHNEEE